jgi:hypothetical protein
MSKKILIEEIKIDRELKADDDLSDLDESALKHPIVVQGDRLIDGLRRVELAKRLGVVKLPAEDPQTLDEAAEVLGKLHTTPVNKRQGWLRVYELMKYLRPLSVIRGRLFRTQHLSRLNRNEDTVHIGLHSRDLIKVALGGVPSSQFEPVVQLIEGGPKEVVLPVLNGEISPAGGLMRWKRRKKFQGRIKGAQEQEVLIQESTQTIRAATDAIWMLDSDIKIDAERLGELIKGLKKARRNLITVINQLEEAEVK